MWMEYFNGMLLALIIEVKWNRSARRVVSQIKECQYGKALADYFGNIFPDTLKYSVQTEIEDCTWHGYPSQSPYDREQQFLCKNSGFRIYGTERALVEKWRMSARGEMICPGPPDGRKNRYQEGLGRWCGRNKVI